MNFTTVMLAGLGGFAGSIGRYALTGLIPFTQDRFAWATFAVNMLGCLCIGILYSSLNQPMLKALLISGVLGGFTTFSGFGLEIFKYLEAGNNLLAATYAGISFLAGTALVWIGNKIALIWI